MHSENELLTKLAIPRTSCSQHWRFRERVAHKTGDSANKLLAKLAILRTSCSQLAWLLLMKWGTICVGLEECQSGQIAKRRFRSSHPAFGSRACGAPGWVAGLGICESRFIATFMPEKYANRSSATNSEIRRRIRRSENRSASSLLSYDPRIICCSICGRAANHSRMRPTIAFWRIPIRPEISWTDLNASGVTSTDSIQRLRSFDRIFLGMTHLPEFPTPNRRITQLYDNANQCNYLRCDCGKTIDLLARNPLLHLH